jgi:phosphatidate cytidylyltransferase
VGVVALVGAATLFLRRLPGRLEVKSLAATVVAAFYPAAPLSLVLLIRDLDQGFEWVILLVTVTFIADSTALILGKSFGRYLLARAISPAKTWEGAAGNLLAAIVTTVAVVTFLSLGITFIEAVLLGILLGVAGQVGDLAESAAKRWAEVKDSGSLLPGHGGVLDRLDSIVFNIPLVYYFSIWVAT